MQPTAIEHLHCGLEALAGLSADDVGRWHAHVVQDDIACLSPALAHLAIKLAERETRQRGRNNERGDARGARTFGPRHEGERAGARCIRDEALRAADEIVAAVFD